MSPAEEIPAMLDGAAPGADPGVPTVEGGGTLVKHYDPKSSTPWKRRVWNWQYMVGRDVLALILFLVAIGFIYRANYIFRFGTRTFPMTYNAAAQSWSGPVELSYPHEPFIISILLAGLLAPLVACSLLLTIYVITHDVWDATAGFFALMQGFVVIICLQVIFKSFIGAFRPHFMMACNPNNEAFLLPATHAFVRMIPVQDCPAWTEAVCNPSGWNMFTRGDLTQDTDVRILAEQVGQCNALRFAMQSFPSECSFPESDMIGSLHILSCFGTNAEFVDT